VREKVAPKVGKALATAAEASKPARKEAKNRTDAALAALRGEVGPPKKRRRSHRLSFLLGAGAVTGAVVALVVRRREPTYPTFEPMTPMGGPDPYAKAATPGPANPAPTNTQPPTAPISSLNDEIAGTLNPATDEATPASEPTTETTTETTTDTTTTDQLDPSSSAANGEATSTIDVTGDPVDLSTADETAATGGRHRKRTRRGEPE
jgi:hypothetical protein